MTDSDFRNLGTTLLILGGALAVLAITGLATYRVGRDIRRASPEPEPELEPVTVDLDENLTPAQGFKRAWVTIRYPAVAERLWGRYR
jgi:hypothetical protein